LLKRRKLLLEAWDHPSDSFGCSAGGRQESGSDERWMSRHLFLSSLLGSQASREVTSLSAWKRAKDWTTESFGWQPGIPNRLSVRVPHNYGTHIARSGARKKEGEMGAPKKKRRKKKRPNLEQGFFSLFFFFLSFFLSSKVSVEQVV
jgi:hypothetical protein